MTPRIRVERIRFFDTPEAAKAFGQPEAEGVVWYEIEYDTPGAVAVMEDGTERRDVSYSYMLQPFRRGPDALVNGRHVWSWDGNREAPTLTPSYLCVTTHGTLPVRAHLFLRAGRIDLCADSTVRTA